MTTKQVEDESILYQRLKEGSKSEAN